MPPTVSCLLIYRCLAASTSDSTVPPRHTWLRQHAWLRLICAAPAPLSANVADICFFLIPRQTAVSLFNQDQVAQFPGKISFARLLSDGKNARIVFSAYDKSHLQQKLFVYDVRKKELRPLKGDYKGRFADSSLEDERVMNHLPFRFESWTSAAHNLVYELRLPSAKIDRRPDWNGTRKECPSLCPWSTRRSFQSIQTCCAAPSSFRAMLASV
jgi:hypothetical protein